MRLCLIFLMLGHGLAVAQTPFCLPPLAFLSSSEDAEVPTIVSAYGQLLDAAGGKLTETVLARLREGESPFVINELTGEDLLTLRRHLAEFKSVVEQKKWNTPALRRAMAEHLADRQRALATNRQGIDRTVTNTQADQRVSLGKGTGLRHGVSPDGAWLIGVDSILVPPPPFTPWHLVVHSMKTGETVRLSGPEDSYYGVPAFDATGAHVLFPLSGLQLRKVPFAQGKLDFSQTQYVGTPDRAGARSSVPGPLHRGVSPHLVYADHIKKGESLLLRFDLNTRQRATAELATVLAPNERVSSWQVVPGTDQLALTIRSNAGAEIRIETYEMDSAGKLQRQKVYGPWALQFGENPVVWTADGKLLSLLNDKNTKRGLYEIPEGTAPPKAVLPLAPFKASPSVNLNPTAFVERPGHDDVAFLYNGGTVTRTNYIAVWNRHTKQQVGLTEVPAGVESIEYTPDGSRLLLRQAGESDGHIVVMRPERIPSP